MIRVNLSVSGPHGVTFSISHLNEIRQRIQHLEEDIAEILYHSYFINILQMWLPFFLYLQHLKLILALRSLYQSSFAWKSLPSDSCMFGFISSFGFQPNLASLDSPSQTTLSSSPSPATSLSSLPTRVSLVTSWLHTLLHEMFCLCVLGVGIGRGLLFTSSLFGNFHDTRNLESQSLYPEHRTVPITVKDQT